MNTVTYLTEIKNLHGIKSPYALAKFLDIGTSNIYGYLHGRSTLSVEMCYRVAEILQKDPAIVLANIERERATKPAQVEFWESCLRRAGAAVSTILISPETPKKRAVGRSSGSDSNFTNYKLYMLGIPPGQDTSKPV